MNSTKSTHVKRYLRTMRAGNLFYARCHRDVEKVLFIATDKLNFVRLRDGKEFDANTFNDEYECELNETLPNRTNVVLTVGTVESWQEDTEDALVTEAGV